jgi:hypothetical protein
MYEAKLGLFARYAEMDITIFEACITAIWGRVGCKAAGEEEEGSMGSDLNFDRCSASLARGPLGSCAYVMVHTGGYHSRKLSHLGLMDAREYGEEKSWGHRAFRAVRTQGHKAYQSRADLAECGPECVCLEYGRRRNLGFLPHRRLRTLKRLSHSSFACPASSPHPHCPTCAPLVPGLLL